ncbi:MAG: MerR family transcriptional regulator [Rhodospirillales bacterium]|nr:MerR family transcriptional regulator [Rhodospirillales bacterium]
MTSGAKSASAFRTISEVASELDLPQHVLRFWETKFNQIRPLKRGGGRRYYRPEDIDLLRQIRGLLYDSGYTIKGVQKLLRDGNGTLPEQTGEVEPVADQNPQVPAQNDNTELRNILGELREIRGILRNWA